MSTAKPAKNDIPDPAETKSADYTARLVMQRERAARRIPGAQIPYAWNINRHLTGLTLDVGCGIGRNLTNLKHHAIGVDHNKTSVETARERGLEAYTVEEFTNTKYATPGTFDGLLTAHVLEHLTYSDCITLLQTYLPYLKPGATVMMICPQEKGYAAETTHIHWVDLDVMARIGTELGLTAHKNYRFPFPRPIGKVFTHNEFCATFTVAE